MTNLSEPVNLALIETRKSLQSVPGGGLTVDVSTNHLTEGDQRLLDVKSASRTREQFNRTVEHEYGWTLFMSGQEMQDVIDECEAAGASQGLTRLVVYANEIGAVALNFDASSDELTCIPLGRNCA